MGCVSGRVPLKALLGPKLFPYQEEAWRLVSPLPRFEIPAALVDILESDGIKHLQSAGVKNKNPLPLAFIH